MVALRKRLFNLLNSQHNIRQFSPEAKEKLLNEYRNSIGLSGDVTFGSEAFKHHADNRIKDHTGFKIQIGSEKEHTLEHILTGNEADKKAVKEQFQEIFKTDDKYLRAQTRYTESIEAFKDLVKDIPEKYSAEDIRGLLKTTQDDARKAIEAQQKDEKERFKLALADGVFKADFKAAVNCDDAEAQKKQDALLAELDKTHAQQLADFDKTSQENLTQLDKASATEMQQLVFTAQLENFAKQLSYDQKVEMQMEIDRLRAENQKNKGSAHTTATVNVKDHSISAINPNDLNFIISLSGQKIEHDTSTNEWSVKLTNRIFSPLYYLSNKRNVMTDILTMTQAVRASGFDSIIMTVNFDDPELQNYRAKQAYKACLDSGFSPDKIKLKDGKGNEIKPGQIFTSDELKTLQQAAQQTQAQLDALKANPTKKMTQDEIKKDLIQHRNAARAKKGTEAVNEAQEIQDKKDLEANTPPTSPTI